MEAGSTESSSSPVREPLSSNPQSVIDTGSCEEFGDGVIITVLEATVSLDRADDLIAAYREGIAALEPGLVETSLVRSLADPTSWRITTTWRDREALQTMRESGQTPRGILFFRAAGTEPALSIFEVVAHAANPDEPALG